MNHKVLTTIQTYGMLSLGSRVVVGVSGGADSVALLHILLQLREELGLALRVLHLNHGLRGEESWRDQHFVLELCRRLGIPCELREVDVAALAAQAKQGVEECARAERYSFFEEKADEWGEGARIATGHTLSDNLETVLFNLGRGAALRGLCGIPPARGRIIRPLIRCTRREVEDYCRRMGLEYVTDSTNLEDRYVRNRIRHQVIPPLKEIFPSLEERAGGAVEMLRRDEDYLRGQAELALEELALEELALGEGGWSRTGLLRLHSAVSCRVLALLLERHGLSRSGRRLELMMEVIRQGSGALQLSEDLYLRCRTDCFTLKTLQKDHPFFCRRFALPPDDEPLQADRLIWRDQIEDKKVSIFIQPAGIFEKNAKYLPNLLKNTLDCDKIEKILTVRQRMPGDRMALPGGNGSKTLKKLLNEKKIPPARRSALLVLDDGGGPAWVEEIGPARRACVDCKTGRMLRIEIAEE